MRTCGGGWSSSSIICETTSKYRGLADNRSVLVCGSATMATWRSRMYCDVPDPGAQRGRQERLLLVEEVRHGRLDVGGLGVLRPEDLRQPLGDRAGVQVQGHLLGHVDVAFRAAYQEAVGPDIDGDRQGGLLGRAGHDRRDGGSPPSGVLSLYSTAVFWLRCRRPRRPSWRCPSGRGTTAAARSPSGGRRRSRACHHADLGRARQRRVQRGDQAFHQRHVLRGGRDHQRVGPLVGR